MTKRSEPKTVAEAQERVIEAEAAVKKAMARLQYAKDTYMKVWRETFALGCDEMEDGDQAPVE